MAKKIVRGITDVKTITNQDFDTNNVNDLLSDGQYNYIHRKKGKNEEYHNLTDNIKTLSSDNTELLSVTNYNKTTNTATLHPKHDNQKEQVLESTRDTITIHHGENGTAEKTTVDTNPQKVLEHENLLTDYGISKNTTGNTTKLSVEYTLVSDGFDLNNLLNGRVRCGKFVNSPLNNTFFFVTAYSDGNNIVQEAVKLFSATNVKYIRQKTGATSGEWTAWREQLTEKSVIDDLLSQKQDTLTAGEGITIDGQTISATGGGPTSTIQFFSDTNFNAYVHSVVTSDGAALTTLSFECYNAAETVLTGDLTYILKTHVLPNKSISNGAISITYDGTNMKLINSSPSENVSQHATFTFHGNTGS